MSTVLDPPRGDTAVASPRPGTSDAPSTPPTSATPAGPPASPPTAPTDGEQPRREGPPRPPRRPLGPRWKVVIAALVVLFDLALGFLAFAVAGAPAQASRSQDVLYSELRRQLAEATAPPFGVGGPLPFIEPGAPVAVMDIPALDVRQVVVEGTSSKDLRSGLGHRRDTALPGQVGVSLVYGRRSTYGGPFRYLEELRAGDVIEVTTGQGSFTYRVDAIRREGDPLPAPPKEGGSRLTLATADGRTLVPDGVVYADATLVRGEPQRAPGPRPATIPPYEKALQSDPGGWLPVVGWLQALAVLIVAGIWGVRRLGRARALLMAVPLGAAVLWNLYDSLLRLLPNLL